MKHNSTFIAAIMAAMFVRVMLQRTQDCTLYKYCDRAFQCQGFENFSQLVLKPCLKNITSILEYCKYSRSHDFKISILPLNSDSILDANLDLRHLQDISAQFRQKSLIIYNIRGIDVDADFHLHSYSESKITSFNILYSTFDFYSSGKKVDCDDVRISLQMQEITDKLSDTLSLNTVQFPRVLCPQIFRNNTIQSLTFEKSVPTFQSVDQQTSLNIRVHKVTISSVRTIKYVLDASFFDKHVFESTQDLVILECSLHKIHPSDLFKDYNKLRKVKLALYNLKGFLYTMGGLDWTKYLNYEFFKHYPNGFFDIGMNLSSGKRNYVKAHYRLIFLYNSEKNGNYSLELFKSYFPYMYYHFPDSDFCLFANFPHKFLIVIFQDHSKISCTMAFLYRFVFYFYLPNDITFEGLNLINETLFYEVYEACNMTQRIDNCNLISLNKSWSDQQYHDPYFDPYDVKTVIEQTKSILLNIIGPLASFVGLSTNILIIATIVHNKRKYKNKQLAAMKSKNSKNNQQHIVLLDEPMYNYMLINSVINASYCLLFLIDLTVQCSAPAVSDGNVSHFKLYKRIDCLVKDCIVMFIASVMKLTSNILIIQISISRFLLLGKDHAKFLVALSEMKVKKVVIGSVLVSILLSVITVFQELFFGHSKYVGINNYFNLENQTYASGSLVIYNDYGLYSAQFFLGKFNSEKLVSKFSQLSIILAFSIIHDLVAYFLFCLFSLVIDISTLKMFKQLLVEHSKMSNKSKEEEKSQRAEKRTFWMVLSFNLANFIFRLPDLLSSVFFIYTSQRPSLFVVLCLTFNECLTLNDLTNVSYILSLGLNFFFYLVFNKNFNESFDEMWGKMTRRIRKKDSERADSSQVPNASRY